VWLCRRTKRIPIQRFGKVEDSVEKYDSDAFVIEIVLATYFSVRWLALAGKDLQLFALRDNMCDICRTC